MGIFGSGNLLHEDCTDRSLLPASSSSDDVDDNTDTANTDDAVAAADAALKAAEVEASIRLGKHTILSISAAAHHTAASTATGTVLSCGTGTDAYGVVDPLEYADNMQLIAKLRSLAECRCGNEHTAAVRANCMVMTWGIDGGGRLGHRRGYEKSKGSTKDDVQGDGDNTNESGKCRPPAAM